MLVVHIVVTRDGAVLPEEADPFRALAECHDLTYLSSSLLQRRLLPGFSSLDTRRREAALDMANQAPVLLTLLIFVGPCEDVDQ